MTLSRVLPPARYASFTVKVIFVTETHTRTIAPYIIGILVDYNRSVAMARHVRRCAKCFGKIYEDKLHCCTPCPRCLKFFDIQAHRFHRRICLQGKFRQLLLSLTKKRFDIPLLNYFFPSILYALFAGGVGASSKQMKRPANPHTASTCDASASTSSGM